MVQRCVLHALMYSLVYVLDDDPLLSKNLAAALAQESGIEVRTFTSPIPFRDACQETMPDALITCVQIADTDCLALAADLQQRDPGLAALVMTSETNESETARAIAALGPLRHVNKPCAMADLLPKLRVALERRRLLRELEEAKSVVESRDAALEESTRRVEQARAELRSTHIELRTATERLMHAEQLAAVGRVVTGIAHELSRQLTLVGYAEAIKSRVAHDAELVEFADIIVSAQKRLTAMVDEIRDFAAAQGNVDGRLDREPADVAAVVDESLALMRYDRDVRKRTILREYRARPLAALHRIKFSQVVINLVSNAVLATEPGDTITVRLETGLDGTDDVAGDASAQVQSVASLTVVDQGEGMPAEVLERLGEPFFTTRGDEGSGLGVGICTRIVEEHGGKLTYKSNVGHGTTARVTIPLLEKDVMVPAGVEGDR